MAATNNRSIERNSLGRLVFDVGFNIGQDTAFYLSQGHRVVAVEADPVLAAAGHERFQREIASGQLEIVNVGIAECEGFADFWICEGKPEFNSFFKEIAARDGRSHHKISVPTTRFANILERFGTPYFLKVDIEGHDMLCLEALDSRYLPQYLSVESECARDGSTPSVEDGLRMLWCLRDLGYAKFKLIDQLTFASLSVPRSINHILHGFCDHYLLESYLRHMVGSYRLSQLLMPKLRLERAFKREFPLGCSGVWGEDTPGRWLSWQQAERAYRYYRDLHFQNSDALHYSFWCDWHARA